MEFGKTKMLGFELDCGKKKMVKLCKAKHLLLAGIVENLVLDFNFPRKVSPNPMVLQTDIQNC